MKVQKQQKCQKNAKEPLQKQYHHPLAQRAQTRQRKQAIWKDSEVPERGHTQRLNRSL